MFPDETVRGDRKQLPERVHLSSQKETLRLGAGAGAGWGEGPTQEKY